MDNSTLITIVIPVYNRRGLITRTLDSIAAQDYRPFNVIVIDNNSTDDSHAVIANWINENEHCGIDVVLLTETTPGAAAARNCGLKEVRTPWTMFFDSDDTMRPNHVGRAVKFIHNNPTADIIGWDTLLHRLDGSTKRLIFRAKNPLFNHLFHATFATQRYAIKTKFINEVGGWDETVLCWDDYVLGVKILAHRPRIIYAGKHISIDIHEQAESITGLLFSDKRGYWEYALNKCCETLNKNGMKQHQKWLTAKRAILAGHYTSEDCGYGLTDFEKLMKSKSSPYLRWALKRIYQHAAKRRRGLPLLSYLLLWGVKDYDICP